MRKSFLKVSVIYATYFIKDYIDKFNTTLDDTIMHLSSASSKYHNFDYENGRSLGEMIGWKEIQSIRDIKEFFRFVLTQIAVEMEPFWFKISYLGRDKVFSVLCEDQIQCFKVAELGSLDNSSDAIEWWEHIIYLSQRRNDFQKLEIGKVAEKKTLILENNRLREMGINRCARRVSIEDSCSGYDVVSYRLVDSKVQELKIEVKSYSYGEPHFYITHNEWKTAINNLLNYKFYIWDNQSEYPLEITPMQLVEHIPINNGDGKWEKVKIYIKNK
ncbi:protein NO VEIN domain-containing protein [Clostridium paraputrificum]|uniref:protein NO VEIN domain-containing protein n=1 Tax=Clostridium paraputrificum TaxID=29363 RepID=UPI001B3C7C0A|nr:DUF3883 domain-containing protein [Clostridium paraputrificum]